MPKAAPAKASQKADPTKAKGSKAKSAPVVETFGSRDLVLAKLKGHPPWPGMVIDTKDVPASVREAAPVGRKNPAYAVRFFPKGDYTWLPASDLKPLTDEDIAAFIAGTVEKKKANGVGRADVKLAYETAQNADEWEKEHLKMLKEKTVKTKKVVKKVAEEVDELDDAEPAAAGTKRKRAAPTKAAPKPAGPKKASAVAASKKAAATRKAAAPAKKAAASKKRKMPKSKATVESEDEGEGDASEDADAEADPEEAAPPAKKAKTAKGAVATKGGKGKAKGGKKGKKAAAAAEEEKEESGRLTTEELEQDPEASKVREWRHRLQRIFLSGKTPIKESDMAAMDELFSSIEAYEDMTVDYLTFSKIGKVMRHVSVLEPEKVPGGDDEYKFRDRAKALVDKWHTILNPDKVAEDGEGDAEAGDLTMLEE